MTIGRRFGNTYARSGLGMIAALAVVPAGSTGAQAALPKDTGGGAVQEIVVTANKREESINKVGLTIKALGGAQLERQHVVSLADLAAAVPGLSFTKTDSNAPVYTLRGIGFYDTTLGAYPSVSVYLDQAPLAFPVMTTLTLFDIERVEVLKGPQGTLFGDNATGGAINYIAAKPTQDPHEGISVDYSRFNTISTDAYVSGPIAKNLLGRLAVKVVDGDGWQKSESRGDSNGAPKSYAARFLLDWKPTDDLHIQTDLNAWRDETQPQQAQFVEFIPNFPVNPLNPAPTLTPNAVSNDRAADWSALTHPSANNRLIQAAIRADYDLTDAITLTSQTSYVDYRQRELVDGDGTPFERIDLVQNNGYAHSFSTELRAANNKDPVFRWTVGGNYQHDRTAQTGVLVFPDASSNHTLAFAGLGFPGEEFTNQQTMDNYAAFAAGEYTISQFTMKAGVRFTEADRSSENCEQGDSHSNPNNIDLFFQNVLLPFVYGHPGVNIANGSCLEIDPATGLPHEFNGTLNENNVSWRVGLDWKPTSTFLGYANVAKGYKAGSFPALSGSSDVAFTPVTQESVVTYEAGIKTQQFNHRVSIDLSTFYSDYHEKQVKSKLNDPVFGQLDALVNIPKSTIKGIELQAATRPLRGLTIGGDLTYLDAKLDNTGNNISLLGSVVPGSAASATTVNYSSFCGFGSNGYSQYCGRSGNPIPYTSSWNLGGNVNYTFPISGSTNGFIGGQATYRSWTTSSIGNEPVFRMPGYALFDVQGGMDFVGGKYRVMLWGKNIFNKFYVVNVARYSDGIQRFTGMPATYGVTLSAKF